MKFTKSFEINDKNVHLSFKFKVTLHILGKKNENMVRYEFIQMAQ